MLSHAPVGQILSANKGSLNGEQPALLVRQGQGLNLVRPKDLHVMLVSMKTRQHVQNVKQDIIANNLFFLKERVGRVSALFCIKNL